MREQILKAPKQQSPVSGEDLSRKQNISRTVVWKHINQLRRSGYQIKSSTKYDYTLIKDTNLLLPEEILSGLRNWMRKLVNYSANELLNFAILSRPFLLCQVNAVCYG